MTRDPLTPMSRVARGQRLLTTDAGASVLMLSIDQAVYCGLDDIASDVWHRLDQPMRIDALCDALCADYHGPRDAIDADVIALLTDLRAHGIIDVV